jgi:hypothetical protein
MQIVEEENVVFVNKLKASISIIGINRRTEQVLREVQVVSTTERAEEESPFPLSQRLVRSPLVFAKCRTGQTERDLQLPEVQVIGGRSREIEIHFFASDGPTTNSL